MRNKIVHGYGSVDLDIVKDTIDNSIPELKAFIEKEVESEILRNPYLLYDIDKEMEDEKTADEEFEF